MKLRQLEAFRLVLARGTTKHAADALGVTQSAVSRLVSQLEDELGFQLFDRRHGRLHITPEGQQFYSVARKALAALDEISATARDIKTLGAGTLRIIAMPALGFGLLPNTIARVRDRYTNIRISVDVGSRTAVEKGISEARYDIGVATLPIEHDSIVVEPLCAMDAVCVMAPDHPLSAKTVIEVEDFEGRPFVSVETGTLFRYRIDELFSRFGVKRDLHIEVQSTVMACNLVALGAGLSIVHPFVADSFLPRVVVRPLALNTRFDYGILFPAGVSHSRVAAAFADTLRDSLA